MAWPEDKTFDWVSRYEDVWRKFPIFSMHLQPTRFYGSRNENSLAMKIEEPMLFAGLTHAFVNPRQDVIHVRCTLRFGCKATVLDQHPNTWEVWNDWAYTQSGKDCFLQGKLCACVYAFKTCGYIYIYIHMISMIEVYLNPHTSPYKD